MERLTEWRDGHGALLHGDGYTKLAQYEDTGFEPGEIKRLEAEWRAAKTVVEELRRFEQYFDSLYGQGLEIANWHRNGAWSRLIIFMIRHLQKWRTQNEGNKRAACREAERL